MKNTVTFPASALRPSVYWYQIERKGVMQNEAVMKFYEAEQAKDAASAAQNSGMEM